MLIVRDNISDLNIKGLLFSSSTRYKILSAETNGCKNVVKKLANFIIKLILLSILLDVAPDQIEN